jgi:hypothetical protein
MLANLSTACSIDGNGDSVESSSALMANHMPYIRVPVIAVHQMLPQVGPAAHSCMRSVLLLCVLTACGLRKARHMCKSMLVHVYSKLTKHKHTETAVGPGKKCSATSALGANTASCNSVLC